MRALPSSVPVACIIALLAAGLPAAATEANINAMLGAKILDHDDWDPVEDQGLLGVQADIRPDGWPVAIAVNVMASSDWDHRSVRGVGTVDTYGGVTELQVGLAGLLPLPGRTTLFAGAGGSFGSALSETWTAGSWRSDWGYGAGTWAHAGAFWTIGSFNIGFGGGWSWVPMTLDGSYVDAGGWRFGLLLGGNIK
jgi:hypothetical protein